MIRSLLKFSIIGLLWVCFSSQAFAGRDNRFSGGFFLGDAYAPNNYRISIYSLDIGASDTLDLYAGSRIWKDNYYAGFGFSIKPAMYGMVGYEWRPISWLGLSGEFVGTMTKEGQANGRVYIGVVAGW